MQVGILQGIIQTPVAITFHDNHDVIVADDCRVQRFDHRGRSVAVIGWHSLTSTTDGWSNLKPTGLAITNDGLLAVADKASQTVRFFHNDGREVSLARRWLERAFGRPAGVAVVKLTGNVVVLDAEQRTVTVHLAGTCPIPPLYCIQSDQLGIPTHVTVDNSGMIFVVDSLNSCIKVTHTFSLFSLPVLLGHDIAYVA